jgi:hypothetical protein
MSAPVCELDDGVSRADARRRHATVHNRGHLHRSGGGRLRADTAHLPFRWASSIERKSEAGHR